MKKIIGFLLFYSVKVAAQTVPLATAMYQLNGFSALQQDAFSTSGNIAALAGIKKFSAGFSGERRFMLAGMTSYLTAVCLPAGEGVFGISAGRYGGPLFGETTLGLSYARSIGFADVGARFNYYSARTLSYSNRATVNFTIGARLRLTEKFQTGIQVHNPTRTGMFKNSLDKLPAVYTVGFGWDVSAQVFVGFVAQKTEGQPTSIRSGLQYGFDKKLWTRLGMVTDTRSFYTGGGILLGKLKLDLTMFLHPLLGISPALTLLYQSSWP